jgi:DNA invertase Pin-like site-specific DNA recombinase
MPISTPRGQCYAIQMGLYSLAVSPPKTGAPWLGYARVSSKEQAADGVSLAEQEALIRQFCEARKLPLSSILLEEGVSGWSKSLMERPVGKTALEAVASGDCAGIVACNIDRISRSEKDRGAIKALLKLGRLVLVDSTGTNVDTAAGELSAEMLMVFGNYQSRVTSERTLRAFDELYRMGCVPTIRVPYGFAVRSVMIDGRKRLKLLRHAVEYPSLVWLMRMVAAGMTAKLGWRILDDVGVVNERGERRDLARVVQKLMYPDVDIYRRVFVAGITPDFCQVHAPILGKLYAAAKKRVLSPHGRTRNIDMARRALEIARALADNRMPDMSELTRPLFPPGWAVPTDWWDEPDYLKFRDAQQDMAEVITLPAPLPVFERKRQHAEAKKTRPSLRGGYGG